MGGHGADHGLAGSCSLLIVLSHALTKLTTLTTPPPPPLQVLVHEFESWASVQAEKSLQFDWDDAMGNTARREAGLRLEKMRNVGGPGGGGGGGGVWVWVWWWVWWWWWWWCVCGGGGGVVVGGGGGCVCVWGGGGGGLSLDARGRMPEEQSRDLLNLTPH